MLRRSSSLAWCPHRLWGWRGRQHVRWLRQQRKEGEVGYVGKFVLESCEAKWRSGCRPSSRRWWPSHPLPCRKTTSVHYHKGYAHGKGMLVLDSLEETKLADSQRRKWNGILCGWEENICIWLKSFSVKASWFSSWKEVSSLMSQSRTT